MACRPEEVNVTDHDQPQKPKAKLGAMDRRRFLLGAAAGAASMAFPRLALGEEPRLYSGAEPVAYDDDFGAIPAQSAKRHAESMRCLQPCAPHPSLAAEH